MQDGKDNDDDEEEERRKLELVKANFTIRGHKFGPSKKNET